MLASIGNFLGEILGLYFTLGCLTVVPGVIVIYLLCLFRRTCVRRANPHGPWLNRTIFVCEMWLGWLNPLLYLIFIYPALVAGDTLQGRPLQILSLLVLALFWLSRVYILEPLRRDVLQSWTARLASFMIVPHIIISINSRTWQFQSISNLHPLVQLLIASHYLAALAMTLSYTKIDKFDFKSRIGLEDHLMARCTTNILTLSIIFMISFNMFHRSSVDGQAFVSRYRESIKHAAAANNIPPGILAAVLTTAITETEIWKPRLEAVVMQMWLADAKSHAFLSRSLDISIGPAQIKPSTLQQGLMIREKCETRSLGQTKEYFPYASKQYRDAGRPTAEWDLGPSFCQKAFGPLQSTPSKTEIIGVLLDDEQAIDAAAFILGLYAAQWEQYGQDIHTNAAILGTLYQIGFEKSRPHAHPIPNQFGLRVAESTSASF